MLGTILSGALKIARHPAIAGLSRRVRALIIAGVLFVALFVLLLTLPVPYVVLSPGPTCNTLSSCEINGRSYPVIGISGIETNKTRGNLNLTTVNQTTQSITAFEAVKGWLRHDEVVVPTSAVQAPGQSQKQLDQQNTQEFTQSQDDATAAALCELKYPKGFGVQSVPAKSASTGKLEAGDLFVSVDGQPADTQAKLQKILTAGHAGQTVQVAVKRQTTTVGRTVPATESITLGAAPKGQQGGRLGVLITTGCLAPFTVDLGLGNEIGGPSAGMMFALGIIDKVGPTDLTGGRFIAGTGTIDPAGNVGAIGGIQLKMIAARDKGASVFLAPAGNCSDVRGNIPAGLEVVKVSTLSQALSDLAVIRRGGHPAGC